MFKFGFSSDDRHEDNVLVSGKCEKKWETCKEFVPKENKLIENILSNAEFKTIHLGDIHLKYLSSNHVLNVLQNGECLKDVSVLKAEQNHSDLLPAIYEGGFKIWECSFDLLNHFYENKITFDKKKVLDLGCGAGIVGIYALMKGATCYFQDYNMDVIEYITAPNILLNSKNYINKCKFYCGDWESFSNILEDNASEDNKFDIIFTSETIYNTENYTKLHGVFEKLLKKSGSIFLAAKSFYFGVGGGISLFEDFLDQNKIFNYSCCWNCTDGVKRQILKIEFKHL